MNTPSPQTKLEEHHAQLFWNNPTKKVITLLSKLEKPIVNSLAADEEIDLTGNFVKSAVQDMQKIFVKQATCAAPFWRDNFTRINIALPEAKSYLQSIRRDLKANEQAFFERYIEDLHDRYRKSAELNDEKFKAGAAAAGISILGFAAAVGASNNRN